MENTSKMKNLTNDLKAFEQMMKGQRKEEGFRADDEGPAQGKPVPGDRV